MALVVSVFFVLLAALAITGRLWYPRRVVLQPWQRGLFLSKGVLKRTLEPGLYRVFPWQQILPVDTRQQILQVAGQEVLTQDGISVKLSLVGEYAVHDPERSVFAAVQPTVNLYAHAQTVLRELAANLPFERLLSDRGELNLALLERVRPRAADLGLTLASLQLRDIMLSGEMKRNLAAVLTAQKQGLGALERARGETAALRSLANAARLMDDSPSLLQLRALQSLESLKTGTLVLGVNEKLPTRPLGGQQ